MTEQELAELASLAKAATPGPWECRETPHLTHPRWYLGQPKQGPYHTLAHVLAPMGGASGTNEANANFIAAANPEKILALISLLQAQQEEIGRLREAVKPFVRLGDIVLAEAPPEAQTIVLFTSSTGEQFSLKLDYFRAAKFSSTQGTQT